MESEIKGLSLRNFPIALRGIRGDEKTDRVLDALPTRELRDGLITGTISASGWYPVAYKRELHQVACRITGEPGLARTMGYEMTRRDLSGIYRTFLRIATPRYVLSIGARIFSTYFRPGKMRVLEVRDGFVQVEFTNCLGFDANIWKDVLGGCDATIVLAGASTTRFHVLSGGGDGHDHALANCWWTDSDKMSDDAKPPP